MRIKKYETWKRENLITEDDDFSFEEDNQDNQDTEDDTDTDSEEESGDSSEGDYNESPETYIKKALDKIGKKVISLIDSDRELEVESDNINKYTRTHFTLTIKYTDGSNSYHILFKINLKDSLIKSKEGEMNSNKLEKCFVKLKQYDGNYSLIGEVGKIIEIDEIKDDFLSILKSEIDDDNVDPDEEIGFEFE